MGTLSKQAFERIERAVYRVESLPPQYINSTPLGPRDEGGTSSSTSAIPCLITGGSTATGYAVTIYGNGISNACTGTGTLYLLDVAWNGENLSSGTYVMAQPLALTITGGSGNT